MLVEKKKNNQKEEGPLVVIWNEVIMKRTGKFN